MTRLRTDDGFGGAGDAVYAALLRAHEGLSDADSRRLDARLVLLLANHVGDPAVIAEALAIARDRLAVARDGLAPGDPLRTDGAAPDGTAPRRA